MEATELTTEATDQKRETRRRDIPFDPAWVDDLRNRLLRDAFLFDDPRIYEAGVKDALANVTAVLRSAERRSQSEHVTSQTSSHPTQPGQPGSPP